MDLRKHILQVSCAVLLLFAARSLATSITGAGWNVYYSLPDQGVSENPGEFDIRDALLGRIDALQSNDQATLATYTFSAAGTAGKILVSISNALLRGASVRFVADYNINTNDTFYGTSLGALAARPGNSLVLVKATNSSGIMHDKIGLFSYGGTNRWVFAGSWNFTSAASYQQWNIMLEVHNNDVLYAAYSNEMAQLLAGHFHYDPAKSHAQDGAVFHLAGSWSNGWVRFAPYPDGRDGGNNAQTDITNVIGRARQEIVFALNTLTRPLIRDALVDAADRGVSIHGVIPKSDMSSTSDPSYAVYTYLTNGTHYATTNIVHFVTPYSKADGSALDTAEPDLVHEKYMIVDPWMDHPTLIHGSANWTDAALVSTNSNDENILFVRHREIARMFYSQFKRMTGMWQDRDDFWCDLTRTNGSLRMDLWTTDTNRYTLQCTGNLTSSWTGAVGSFSGWVGRTVLFTNATDAAVFFRAQRN
jgi:phosphatidylserine/phosphatidylglycerophosphate/cardiolipin synthase-like enzyme